MAGSSPSGTDITPRGPQSFAACVTTPPSVRVSWLARRARLAVIFIVGVGGCSTRVSDLSDSSLEGIGPEAYFAKGNVLPS